jgi:predicted Zn-dependent protease
VPAFQLLLLKDDSPNVFSTAGGRIFVDRGMRPMVGRDSALWAAVIAHEVGHIVQHHQYKHYMRAIQLRAIQQELARKRRRATRLRSGRSFFRKLVGRCSI